MILTVELEVTMVNVSLEVAYGATSCAATGSEQDWQNRS